MTSYRKIPLSLRFRMFLVGQYYFQFVSILFFILCTFITIANIRSFQFIWFFELLALLFLIFLTRGWIKSYKQIQVLKNGQLSRARYVSSNETHYNANMRKVLRHTYSYYGEDDLLYKVHMDSTDVEPPLIVDILFHAKEQNKAVILCGLPGKPSVHENGHLTPVRFIGSVLMYIVYIYIFILQ